MNFINYEVLSTVDMRKDAPDVREKLVGLMCDVLEDGCTGHCNYPPCWKVTNAVDGLIANGVTVQSEIDAKTFQLMRECERLKEEKESLANAVNALEEINSDLCKQIKGVTVREWISQTEFPWMGEEIAKLCIRYMEEYAYFYGYASSKKVKDHIVRLLELEKDGRIAILPQPSKGE